MTKNNNELYIDKTWYPNEAEITIEETATLKVVLKNAPSSYWFYWITDPEFKVSAGTFTYNNQEFNEGDENGMTLEGDQDIYFEYHPNQDIQEETKHHIQLHVHEKQNGALIDYGTTFIVVTKKAGIESFSVTKVNDKEEIGLEEEGALELKLSSFPFCDRYLLYYKINKGKGLLKMNSATLDPNWDGKGLPFKLGDSSLRFLPQEVGDVSLTIKVKEDGNVDDEAESEPITYTVLDDSICFNIEDYPESVKILDPISIKTHLNKMNYNGKYQFAIDDVIANSGTLLVNGDQYPTLGEVINLLDNDAEITFTPKQDIGDTTLKISGYTVNDEGEVTDSTKDEIKFKVFANSFSVVSDTTSKSVAVTHPAIYKLTIDHPAQADEDLLAWYSIEEEVKGLIVSIDNVELNIDSVGKAIGKQTGASGSKTLSITTDEIQDAKVTVYVKDRFNQIQSIILTTKITDEKYEIKADSTGSEGYVGDSFTSNIEINHPAQKEESLMGKVEMIRGKCDVALDGILLDANYKSIGQYSSVKKMLTSHLALGENTFNFFVKDRFESEVYQNFDYKISPINKVTLGDITPSSMTWDKYNTGTISLQYESDDPNNYFEIKYTHESGDEGTIDLDGRILQNNQWFIFSEGAENGFKSIKFTPNALSSNKGDVKFTIQIKGSNPEFDPIIRNYTANITGGHIYIQYNCTIDIGGMETPAGTHAYKHHIQSDRKIPYDSMDIKCYTSADIIIKGSSDIPKHEVSNVHFKLKKGETSQEIIDGDYPYSQPDCVYENQKQYLSSSSVSNTIENVYFTIEV